MTGRRSFAHPIALQGALASLSPGPVFWLGGKPVAKQKRKLTAAQKAEKARLRREYMWIFVGGKQKRVRRPPTIDGMDADEFLRRNANPLWLHQEGLWHLMPEFVAVGDAASVCDEEAAGGFSPAGAD